jgi:hypothetical protein
MNQLKAERSKTNQMEATFNNTITGLQKTPEKKECSKNQAKTELYGTIRLYKNQLKAERDKTNQMEATFHDSINGLKRHWG